MTAKARSSHGARCTTPTSSTRSRLMPTSRKSDPTWQSRTLRAATSTSWAARTDPKLLSIRVFDDRTKVGAYEQQTQKAKAAGVYNCPPCAIGHDANKTRIYEPTEMDTDHVTAWSKGGDTDLKNCEMLCVIDNRAKGNR